MARHSVATPSTRAKRKQNRNNQTNSNQWNLNPSQQKGVLLSHYSQCHLYKWIHASVAHFVLATAKPARMKKTTRMSVVAIWWWQLPKITRVLRRWFWNHRCRYISFMKSQKAASLSSESIKISSRSVKPCNSPNSDPNSQTLTKIVKENSEHQATSLLQTRESSIWSADEEVAWSQELKITSSLLNSLSNKSGWGLLVEVAAKTSLCLALRGPSEISLWADSTTTVRQWRGIRDHLVWRATWKALKRMAMMTLTTRANPSSNLMRILKTSRRSIDNSFMEIKISVTKTQDKSLNSKKPSIKANQAKKIQKNVRLSKSL